MRLVVVEPSSLEDGSDKEVDAAAEVIEAELASALDSEAAAEVLSGGVSLELVGGSLEGILGLDSAVEGGSDEVLGSEIEGLSTEAGAEGLSRVISLVVTVTTAELSREGGVQQCS